ncbi:succinyl-CoA synthetase subunit alpha [Candidatus Micrarchaeota archaeon]|nr:succinyl-CoA synthetase subunit alpha [Candidatus Micrarchaeota archaeon]
MDGNCSAFSEIDQEKYIGQWVAIVDKKIVSSGKSFADVYAKAKKKFPSKIPFLAPVTTNKVFIL